MIQSLYRLGLIRRIASLRIPGGRRLPLAGNLTGLKTG